VKIWVVNLSDGKQVDKEQDAQYIRRDVVLPKSDKYKSTGGKCYQHKGQHTNFANWEHCLCNMQGQGWQHLDA
jgi:hypothetical protein